MARIDDVFHVANEAIVMLHNLAERLRSGADISIVAEQADVNAETLLEALAETRD